MKIFARSHFVPTKRKTTPVDGGINPEKLRWMYKTMWQIRAFEEKVAYLLLDQPGIDAGISPADVNRRPRHA